MRERKKSQVIPIDLCIAEMFVQLNETDQLKPCGTFGFYQTLFHCLMCVYLPSDMKKLETARRGETGRGNVGGKGFEAGPFMSALIIVRLKVGHTLWACLHKEQECSYCAGRLAG